MFVHDGQSQGRRGLGTHQGRTCGGTSPSTAALRTSLPAPVTRTLCTSPVNFTTKAGTKWFPPCPMRVLPGDDHHGVAAGPGGCRNTQPRGGAGGQQLREGVEEGWRWPFQRQNWHWAMQQPGRKFKASSISPPRQEGQRPVQLVPPRSTSLRSYTRPWRTEQNHQPFPFPGKRATVTQTAED